MSVMHQQIFFFRAAVAERYDFHVQTGHANALVAILAEDQGLAMLQLDDVLAAGFALGERKPRAIVKDIAVLQDFDER